MECHRGFTVNFIHAVSKDSFSFIHLFDLLKTGLIRVFPKVDHSGNNARIVLEQNKVSKKLPLTEIEPLAL